MEGDLPDQVTLEQGFSFLKEQEKKYLTRYSHAVKQWRLCIPPTAPAPEPCTQAGQQMGLSSAPQGRPRKISEV